MPYTKLKLNLNKNQAQDLYDAIQNSKGVKLVITKENITGSGVPVLLSAKQLKQLKEGNPILSFSAARLKKIKGEALPLLIPLISMILSGIGTAASVGTSIATSQNAKKAQEKQLNEQIRHNKEIEKEMKGDGSSVYCGKCGAGYYLKPYAKGSGYYLKPFLA